MWSLVGTDLIFSIISTGLLGAAPEPPAAAQAQPIKALGPDEPIIITGKRDRVAIGVVRSVGTAEVPLYGVGTVGELLEEIAAEDGVFPSEIEILVDGRRIRSRVAINDFPVEAIEQIDLLAPGSSTQIGGPANRRTYNVVLRSRVKVVAAQLAHRMATEGQFGSSSGEASYTQIRKPTRINLSIKGSAEDSLLEADRQIEQPQDGFPRLEQARTLRPNTDRLEAGISVSGEPQPSLRVSFNAKASQTRSKARFGLSNSGTLLEQQTSARIARSDVLIEGDVGSWIIALSGDIRSEQKMNRTVNETNSERRVASTVDSQMLEISANGPLISIPAGSVRLAVAGSVGKEKVRTTINDNSSHARTTMKSIGAAVDFPIASQSNGIFAALGDLAIGVEARRSWESRQGPLSFNSASIKWQPTAQLHVYGSISATKSAPSTSLLFEPLIETPGIRIFDPIEEKTVDVVAITGGNSKLGAFKSLEKRLSIQIKPLKTTNLSVSFDIEDRRNRNFPTSLPVISNTILAAFPERFLREAGRLVRVDFRPVSLALQKEQLLRAGLLLTVPVRNLFDAGIEGKRSARFQLNASYTNLLRSELKISSDVEPIDLLSKGSLALSSEPRPRHLFSTSVGYAERGFGIRAQISYRSASFLGLGVPQDESGLRLSPLSIIDLRSHFEASRLIPNVSSLRGARLTVSVNNLFNKRETVRDDKGFTPLNFQPGYRDPIGRTVEVELRKAW